MFTETDKVIYKQILCDDEAKDYNNKFLEQMDIYGFNTTMVLSTGHRQYIDINLKDYEDITSRLFTVLRDYFPDLQVDHNARFYNHQYGSVKPHIDKCHDGISKYTLLLYLTENFDDGKLSIKMKRTDEEKLEDAPNKHHKVFTFTPLRGCGVIFDKSLLHYAGEIVEGHKNFLLIHLASKF